MNINRQLTGALVYGAVLVFVITLPAGGLADRLLSPRFNPQRFPVAAADFIRQTKPEGNMFSNDQFGGYLIYRLYPQIKVFVDGRSDFYRQGAVLEDFDRIVMVNPQWSESLNKYDVQWMVLQRNEPLATVALMSGQWTSVHEDSVALVLVRKSSPQNQSAAGRLKSDE
jgi:hypothetical protein